MDCYITRMFEIEKFNRTLDARFAKFNLKCLDDIISCFSHDDESFKIYLNGIVARDKYIKNKSIRMHEIYNLIGDGATLVVNKIENYSKLFQKIRFIFSHILGENVHVNGYLSKSGESPFGLHWDSHDVFAIQLYGKKHWDVYSRTISNPTERNKHPNYRELSGGDLLFSESIFPGTVLYVPSGSFHAVKPLGELSFHITVGIHPLRGVDALFFAIEDRFHEYSCLRAKLRWKDSNAILSGISEIDFPELTRSMLKVEQNIEFLSSFSCKSLTEELDFSGSLLYTKLRLDNSIVADDECKNILDYVMSNQFTPYERLTIEFGNLSEFTLKDHVQKLLKSGLIYIMDI